MRKALVFVFSIISFSLTASLSPEYFQKAADFHPAQIPHEDFFAHHSVIVWGSGSTEEDESDLNEMMANNVVDFRIKRWLDHPENVEDIIKDQDLTAEYVEQYNLILVGTPNSNSVLSDLAAYLPVQISEQEIHLGDQTFSGDEVGIMYRYPNPLNPHRMLWIVSAPHYEALRFIPQESEFCVYSLTDYNPQADRFLELALENFDENWQVKQVPLVDNEVIDSGENDVPKYEPTATFPAPNWAHSGVMYEIFVRSFADSNHDGRGDLQGILSKLDYLNDGDPQTSSDLGIKVIWLMPVLDSPSYHGYDVRDYFTINQDYGTNADFQQLLQEAHRRGIKLITDLVLNHCSNQHPFFLDAYGNPDSKFDHWFFFTNPSNTRANNWEFRHRPTDRAMLNPPMPAWNVNNPAVQDYLINMAKYWMDPNADGDLSDGVDGFRCDYAKGPPAAFWQKFRFEVKSLNPEILLLAENWDGMSSIAESFDNQFDMAFDFPFQGSVMELVSSGTASPLIRLLNEQEAILPKAAIMNRFINNHDMNRIFTRLDDTSAKLSLSLLLSLPDMPMLYYGDEIGMQGQKDPYDEGIRRPMEWCTHNDCPEMTDWYPVWNQEADGISVQEEQSDPNSILNFTKKLIRLRREHPVLENGKITIIPVFEEENGELNGSKRALCYTLQDDRETILAIASLREDRMLLIGNNFAEKVEFIPLLHAAEVGKSDKYLKINCTDKTLYLFFVRAIN